MRILHIVSTVNPATGGVAESIIQRGIQLEKFGHELEVVSLDNPSSDFIINYPLKIHALGPSYTSWKYNRKIIPWIKKNEKNFDCIIVDGIWQYHCYAAWRTLKKSNTPYFVFPHGMLDPWFKKKYPLKHFKKWLFWPWAEYRLIRDASAVLFTCEEERNLARKSFWLYKAKEHVVAFGTAKPIIKNNTSENFYNKFPSLKDKKFLLFLSRIHPKKGCDLLIEAFSIYCKQDPSLHIAIAGTGSPEYIRYLKNLTIKHNLSEKIHWLDMIQGDVKWGALSSCESFILPSHQENFGIAVVESLACGKPVLISNKINIHTEITSNNVGYVEDDSVAGVLRLLHKWKNTGPSDRVKMSILAQEVFMKNFSAEAMAQSIIDLTTELRNRTMSR